MSTATEREFRADPDGVERLMAGPGDEAPAEDATAPGPNEVTMGPQDYTPKPLVDYLESSAPAVSTAGDDASHAIGEVRRDGVVSDVSYTPDATITGAATNNRKIQIVNKGTDGAGTTVVAELGFGSGVSATGFVEKALTLGDDEDLVVAEGDVLAFVSTHVGTGIADPGGLVQVQVRPDGT